MRLAAVIWALRAELLVGAALLGGWSLLTWGIVELTSRWVWQISAGLLLLSCCGWKWLRVLATRGLYALTREKDA